MGFAVAIIIILYNLIKEACQRPYPSGSFNNSRLLQQDRAKVICGQMTQKQLERNIMNGKYR